MQKITESCFARWMTILSETPGSLLWLLAGDEDVNQHLQGIAEKVASHRNGSYLRRRSRTRNILPVSASPICFWIRSLMALTPRPRMR